MDKESLVDALDEMCEVHFNISNTVRKKYCKRYELLCEIVYNEIKKMYEEEHD